jgi:hypothetical protein
MTDFYQIRVTFANDGRERWATRGEIFLDPRAVRAGYFSWVETLVLMEQLLRNHELRDLLIVPVKREEAHDRIAKGFEQWQSRSG